MTQNYEIDAMRPKTSIRKTHNWMQVHAQGYNVTPKMIQ